MKSMLAAVLENMRRNVVSGITEAIRAGVDCEMPSSIEVDMPLDSNGLPCTCPGRICAARIKVSIRIQPNPSLERREDRDDGK